MCVCPVDERFVEVYLYKLKWLMKEHFTCMFVQFQTADYTLYVHIWIIWSGWWRHKPKEGLKKEDILSPSNIFSVYFLISCDSLVWFLFVDYMLRHWQSKWNDKCKLPSYLKKDPLLHEKMPWQSEKNFVWPFCKVCDLNESNMTSSG